MGPVLYLNAHFPLEYPRVLSGIREVVSPFLKSSWIRGQQFLMLKEVIPDWGSLLFVHTFASLLELYASVVFLRTFVASG